MTALEKKQKKISVIIPVYNAEKYLRETLDSVIKQSYNNWEILLIENGSKDKSPEIIREYEAQYPGIHMLKGSGKGPGPARNMGLRSAKGDYIVFADADDYLPDVDIFRKYISMAEQTGADIVVSNYARLWENRVLPAVKHETFALCSPYSEEFRFRGFFSVGTLSYVWGKFYRSEFLKKYQIIFGNISYAEDKLFNMECYICDAKYVFLEDTGYIYRKNDTSVSWQYRPDSTQNWFKLANELKGWIEKKNKDPNKYASLTRYLIFFAVFFDAKMEYMQHKKSIWAIRKVLKKYGTNPLGKKVFSELSDRKRKLQLDERMWKIMIRTFSWGMELQWYVLLAAGIKILVAQRVDERLSDTGMRE